jgi:8-oxo-dGTP pyrophosphatase MutT (NUDIX family)
MARGRHGEAGSARRGPRVESYRAQRQLTGRPIALVLSLVPQSNGAKATGERGTARFEDNASMLLDQGLKDLVRERLRAFPVRGAEHGPHRHAAVAVAIVQEGWGAQVDGLACPDCWSSEAALILTLRSVALSNHAGQWALPGGRVDQGETVVDAALRELREEVGLHLPAGAVLGRLDDFITRSGFVISPVVVWAGEAPGLQANAAEVASIHRIRIEEFMRSDAPLLEPTQDSTRPILRMPVGRAWIAAPTAAVLYQFREVCIAGRATRVAHFDQPLFARR